MITASILDLYSVLESIMLYSLNEKKDFLFISFLIIQLYPKFGNSVYKRDIK